MTNFERTNAKDKFGYTKVVVTDKVITKAEIKLQKINDEVEALRKQYPFLVASPNKYCGNTASKNVKKLLKNIFPNVKFSVTQSRGSMSSSINVDWTGGPELEEVNAIASKFKHGNFDGMTDSYNYVDTAWNRAFGGVNYVFCHREELPELSQ